MKAKIVAFTHKQTNIFQVQAVRCQTHNFNQIKAFEKVSQTEMCDIDSIWNLNSFQLNLSDLLALEMFLRPLLSMNTTLRASDHCLYFIVDLLYNYNIAMICGALLRTWTLHIGVTLALILGAFLMASSPWMPHSVFEYIRIICTEYIRIPNYSLLFKNRIIFVFVFGWNFQTEYIRIRIRFQISSRIYSYSYSVRKKIE